MASGTHDLVSIVGPSELHGNDPHSSFLDKFLWEGFHKLYTTGSQVQIIIDVISSAIMPQITAGVYFQLQQRDPSVYCNLGVVQSVHIPGQYVYCTRQRDIFPATKWSPAHRHIALVPSYNSCSFFSKDLIPSQFFLLDFSKRLLFPGVSVQLS